MAVHFQAVTDRFSPHDTIANISSSDELNEHAMSAACSLHTAAPSSSSSNSSTKKNKLDWITEDAEEGQGVDGEILPPVSTLTRSDTAASKVETPLKTETLPVAFTAPMEDARPSSPRVTNSEDNDKRRTITEATQAENKDGVAFPTTTGEFDYLYEASQDRRFSSQTARPSPMDLYAAYKPKVKLGPRPRPSLDMKRPNTSGNPARPVASLPAGMKAAPKKGTLFQRPKSRDSAVPSISMMPPPPVPNIPDMSLMLPTRSKSSAASVRSLPAIVHRMPSSPEISQEKQRLMKALELRKKQLSAQKQRKDSGPDVRHLASANSIPLIHPARTTEKESTPVGWTAAADKGEKPPQGLDGALQAQTTHTSTEVAVEMNSKADSGIDVIVDEGVEPEGKIPTPAASSPVSAHEDVSTAHSTTPSSISGDDDHDLVEPNNKQPVGTADTPTNDNNMSTSSHVDEKYDESAESSPTIVPERNSLQQSNDNEQPSQLNRIITSTDVPISDIEKKLTTPIIIEPENRADHDDVFQTESIQTVLIPPDPLRSGIASGGSGKERRRAKVEPIQTSHSHSVDTSDNDYLSDDSFMDELQSAKVEEAKPVSVSKSPITPFFPRRMSSHSGRLTLDRSMSHSVEADRPSLGRTSPSGNVLSMVRSFSGGSVSNSSSAKDPMQIAKSSKVSSGISQRIKALADNSNRDSLASINQVPNDQNFPTLAWRKSSLATSPTPSRNSSISLAAPAKRVHRTSTPPLLDPSAVVKGSTTPVSMPSSSVYNVVHEDHQPDSVSVTARIIRNQSKRNPSLSPSTDAAPFDLHESQITIDHHRAADISVVASTISLPKSERSSVVGTPTSPRSRDSSQPPPLPRNSSETSWRSLGRRGGSEAKMNTHDKSPSMSSVEGFSDDSKSLDKKESRTSRLFKRMSSSISNASRKSIISVMSSPKEDVEVNKENNHLQTLHEPPPSIEVGELNIQFPDTLLWKRRWVEVDSNGNLVLSASRSNDHKGGITKRYHLTEFRTPYAPDQDSQELPNSVLMEFRDGSTLQCACETSLAQLHVLQSKSKPD